MGSSYSSGGREDCRLFKNHQGKATNMGLIQMRGSHFNLNAYFKANTRVVFQLRCRLYQVGDVKIEFNTKLDNCVDHQNANLSSFMF